MSVLSQVIWIGGAVIVVAVALQGLFFVAETVWSASHRREQRRRELALWDSRLEAVRQRNRSKDSDQWSWTGWRKFQVCKKECESSDGAICSFYLKSHDAKPIPSFAPGQFLTFRVSVPNEPRPLVRCYSLSGEPARDGNQSDYRVSIKRLAANPRDPESKPGRCSNFFHDEIQVGDLLDVKPPSGKFVLDMDNDTPVVLIGGGVGLTPMMSMLQAIAASGVDRETWFFYGVRDSTEHAMAEHMRKLAEIPSVHLHVCYSKPLPTDKRGDDYDHPERVSLDVLKRVLPSNNYHFYMCGPGPMMDSMTQGLDEWGVPDTHVHLEAFGPSAPKKKPQQADPAAAGPMVTFRRSEKNANWDPNLEHLWEFAKANGVTIDSGCLQGNCGSCETAIVKGKVKYPNGDPAFEFQDGSCLTCCAQPDGPVELDA